MADQKISQLPSKSSLATTDLIPIVDVPGGTLSKQIAVSVLDARYLLLTGGTLTGDLILTASNSNDNAFQLKKSGDTFPRIYMNGYGSILFGGQATSAPQLQFANDPFTVALGNFTNIVGPASILVIDSNVANSGGPNAESTVTCRVITGSGGSEWVDWFHNHYSTNGDMNYGILLQKIAPGSYRNFLTLFTDNASSDPSGQVKNANFFEVITPTISSGSSGGTALTGTAAKTSGSPIITGTGTAFDTQLQINDSIAIGSEYATILSVDSATQVTCVSNLTATGSGLTVNKFNRFLGRKGIRVRYPTAFLHIGAAIGGATVGSASLKIDAGTLLTTAEAGAIENNGTNLFFTPSSTRQTLAFVNISKASSAGSVTGQTITLTSAETQAIGDAVTINSSGNAHLAKADAIANASAVLLAAAAVSGSGSNTYLLPGGTMKLSSSPSWTVGGLVYLSTTGTTGNTLTQTAPSSTNNVIQVLGIAIAADTLLFEPSLAQVEHS